MILSSSTADSVGAMVSAICPDSRGDSSFYYKGVEFGGGGFSSAGGSSTCSSGLC